MTQDETFDAAQKRFMADLADYRASHGRDAVRGLSLPGWEKVGEHIDRLDSKRCAEILRARSK